MSAAPGRPQPSSHRSAQHEGTPVSVTTPSPSASAPAALVPTTWTTGSTDAIKTGTWRASLAKHIKAPAPCHGACPVNGDIAEWIGLARARDFHGSWQVLARHNPFPSIAGRICHHPCETACNRAGYDEALSEWDLQQHDGQVAVSTASGRDAAMHVIHEVAADPEIDIADAVEELDDPDASAEALRHVLVGGVHSVEDFAAEVADHEGGDVLPPHEVTKIIGEVLAEIDS